MFQHVLVPTDGSDHALRAAEHGATLAEAFDATLSVIAVVDLQVEAGPFSAGGLTEEVEERMREDAQRRIDRTMDVIDGPADVRSEVLEGVPVEDIVEYADEHAVDLVVMGTQGRTGVDRYVAGSVAEGVIRNADPPVLTVRAADWSHGADPYEEILLPTDGSEYASAAVEPTLAIAERFDARVHVLHVVDVRNVAASGGPMPPGEIIDNYRSQGESAIERIAERVREADLAVTTHVEEGVAPSGVLDYAEEEGVDLIAMGTAGRTGLNRFLLGSTAERVVRHAEMPVLAVNARDEETE